MNIFFTSALFQSGREDFAILRRSRKRTQALVETNLPGILDQLIRPMVSPKTGISRELGVPVAIGATPQVTHRVIDCHALENSSRDPPSSQAEYLDAIRMNGLPGGSNSSRASIRTLRGAAVARCKLGPDNRMSVLQSKARPPRTKPLAAVTEREIVAMFSTAVDLSKNDSAFRVLAIANNFYTPKFNAPLRPRLRSWGKDERVGCFSTCYAE